MRDSIRVDDLDRSIIDRLKQDARATNRSLAIALGVTERTVAARIQRLEEANLLRVMAILDMEAAGFARFVVAGIQVSGRAPTEVAAEIADLPCVSGIAACLGGFELVAVLYARDEEDLFEQLERRIGSVRGVEEIESFLVLDQLLHRVDWATLATLSPVPRWPLQGGRCDALDRSIVEELQEDGRRSFREIARRLRCAEGTVRTRLQRMENTGICRLQAVTDISLGPGVHYAWIAIKARHGWMRRVAEAIAKRPGTGFVGTTLGRFDVMALVLAEDRDALAQRVFENVSLMGGVQRIEAWVGLETYKTDFRVAKLSAARSLPASDVMERRPREAARRKAG